MMVYINPDTLKKLPKVYIPYGSTSSKKNEVSEVEIIHKDDSFYLKILLDSGEYYLEVDEKDLINSFQEAINSLVNGERKNSLEYLISFKDKLSNFYSKELKLFPLFEDMSIEGSVFFFDKERKKLKYYSKGLKLINGISFLDEAYSEEVNKSELLTVVSNIEKKNNVSLKEDSGELYVVKDTPVLLEIESGSVIQAKVLPKESVEHLLDTNTLNIESIFSKVNNQKAKKEASKKMIQDIIKGGF